MKTLSSNCPYCGKEYTFIKIPGLFGKDGRSVRSTCCGCDGETQARRAEEVKRIQQDLRTAWARTEAPERMLGVQPDKTYLETIATGKGFYIQGPKGTGKTTRACQILKAYVARFQRNGYASARFIATPTWLASMRQDWGSKEEDAYQRAAGVRLLVLDDVGKGKSTEWAMERLFRLVNDRYNGNKPTIFTSNYRLEGLGARCTVGDDSDTAEAMVSRIHEMCEVMEIGGIDHRLA